MSTNYEELAIRAERGELAPKGNVVRGAAAAEEGMRLLMEVTGATSPEEITRIAVGRPSLSGKAGASPLVRARVPQALKDRVTELAEREHVKESEVVRKALAAYVEMRTAS